MFLGFCLGVAACVVLRAGLNSVANNDSFLKTLFDVVMEPVVDVKTIVADKLFKS